MIVPVVGLDDLSSMLAHVSLGTFGSLSVLFFLKTPSPEHTGKYLAVCFSIFAAANGSHVDVSLIFRLLSTLALLHFDVGR